ncbi:MAG: hypothetical protein OEY06_01865 [Gammaproteobacteria bacterium]|nr:hypothetical protein [Gammaproteobacteria bacterium]
MLVTIGFVVTGTGFISMLFCWHYVIVTSAVLSSLIFILFWAGKLHQLDNQGGYGILINFVIIVMVSI